MIFPGNGMRIKNQLVFTFQIVKNRHLPVSDDDQLLLLEGMKPGDEDMRLHTAGKRKKTDCHIRDLVVEIIASLGLQHQASLAPDPGSPKYHGAQKTRECFPHGGFFPDSDGWNRYIRPGQFAIFNHFFQLEYGRMIPEKMAHHKNCGVYPKPSR